MRAGVQGGRFKLESLYVSGREDIAAMSYRTLVPATDASCLVLLVDGIGEARDAHEVQQ